ncbi:hypothetical protein RYH80_05190 [Halobaculum sp. MBLA0147]|uniref:DUF7561 family protein n=1 Tax=Halobaculum sp. MBLA0147 TaxID=3079934 RepID=UPI0035258F6D
MASRECDGCGDDVSVAGGVANLWTLEADATGGLTLELADGAEVFCCFDCLDRLPDDETVTVEHVDALGEE